MPSGHAHNAPRLRSAKPLEDRVAVLFALFGFIGGIVLHLTLSSPVITGWFLGTGVASLVYGCLGGIHSAGFHVGPFKVTGSLAALAGVAYITNQQLHNQQDREERLEHYRAEQIKNVIAVPVEGVYEWQWAGQGWISYVTVRPDGAADLDMKEFVTCGANRHAVPATEQRRAGKAELINGGLKLSISIPVRFIHYDDGCNRTSLDAEETVLTGLLDRRAAYAGRIQYRPDSPPGDMILIKDYRSAIYNLNVGP